MPALQSHLTSLKARLLPPAASWRLFPLLEALFILSLPWQTRLNLSEVWPNFLAPPIHSDYLYPYLYLSQLLFLATFTLWLWQSHRRSNLRNLLKISALDSSLGIFLAISIIALILTPFFSTSPQWWNIYPFFRLLQGLLLAFFIYHRLREGAGRKYLFLALLALLGQQAVALSQWLLQHSLGLQWLGEWRFSVHTPGIAKVILQGQEHLRPYGTFAHPNILAGIMAALSIPLLQHLRLTYAKHPRWRTMQAGYLGLSSLVILLTFSRVAWVLYALSVGWYFYPHLQRILSHPKAPTRASWPPLLLALLVLPLIPLLYTHLTSFLTYDYLTLSRRLQLNQVALDLIHQHPWSGIGPNNFMLQIYSYGPLYGIGLWRQPVHNIPLLLATEYGLPALILLVITLTLLLIKLFRLSPLASRLLKASLIWIWLVVLITSQVDHYWYTITPATQLAFILLAVTLYALKPIQHKRQKTNS